MTNGKVKEEGGEEREKNPIDIIIIDLVTFYSDFSAFVRPKNSYHAIDFCPRQSGDFQKKERKLKPKQIAQRTHIHTVNRIKSTHTK